MKSPKVLSGKRKYGYSVVSKGKRGANEIGKVIRAKSCRTLRALLRSLGCYV